jgi:hypothetical protein
MTPPAGTARPWYWATSNSFLRLNGADDRDGGVAYAHVCRDGQPTIVCSEADRELIVTAVNSHASLVARVALLEGLLREACVLGATANQDHTYQIHIADRLTAIAREAGL